ncbi:phytanoyl-CoA dioxygenase family protein [Pseudomonadales bacterium]|nr:phytanoyl-CoA dioxygenase family protein [Pseudomonadales bacterium]
MLEDPMLDALTEAEIQAYQSQGFILRRSVFSRVEIEQFNAAIDRLAAAVIAQSHEGQEYRLDGRRFVDLDSQTLQFEPAPFEQDLRVLEPAHPLSSAVLTLLKDTRLVQPMQVLTGSDHVSLWTDKINFKRPGGSEFGWHQDAPYWMHDAAHLTQLPNVMVTLDDVVPGSGGFRVVQGSHQAGIHAARNDGTQLEGFYTHDDAVDISQVVEFNEPAGSAIFFDPFLIHGSARNESGKRRRALIATYQAANLPTLKTKQVVNLG